MIIRIHIPLASEAGGLSFSAQFQSSLKLSLNKNFGGGSLREAAVLALESHGTVSIIAPNLGDIFYANCVKNGIP